MRNALLFWFYIYLLYNCKKFQEEFKKYKRVDTIRF